MNTLSSYTLASRAETGRFLRLWAVLLRGTFSSTIFLLDVVLIVSMSCATGLAYSLAAYRNSGDVFSFVQVGVLAASIFAISNAFRGEYRLPNFFAVKPHARRTIQLWNVTLIGLLLLGFLTQISAQYSRAWIVLFYATTLGVLIFERFLVVRITAHARAAGLVSAQRIFLIGTGAHIGAFLNYYEPWTLGINIVGARFITPVAATATNAERRAALDQDLAEATASVRGVEPDAIFLLLPWSATATIERCAEAFLSLPVEIHLGPEQILHKFEDVELSKLGPLASLQLTRMPLTTFEVVQKRLFDLVFAAIALLALTPLLIVVALLISLDSPGPVFFVQRRFGFNQQPFRIIKFRTMRTLDDGAVVPQAVRNDPRAHPHRTPGCGAGTSTKFRSSSTCSLATCRWSVRARTRCRTTATTSSAFRSTRAAITSSPALPAGRRSTAFAARPTPTRRCASASNTICSISTTGRCGST